MSERLHDAQSACEYFMINAISDSPTPHVIGIRPPTVTIGDNMTIIAVGIDGDMSSSFGSVQMMARDGYWLDVAHRRWEKIDASSDAYNSYRVITDDMETVDVEHVEIDVIVPNWVSPSSPYIRVVTNTP